MGKSETDLLIRDITEAYREKDYNTAAKLAEKIDWSKEKDWSLFAMMIDVEEQVGNEEEARDMAILAYNRNLGGRQLLYRLAEILIKLGDFENAEEVYNEYAKVAKHNSNRFILKFHLQRARKDSVRDQIKTLEAFREAELDDHYMYRLAQLYTKAGREDKAVQVCDDITLWFASGKYVTGAVQLKKRLGVNLTPEQEKIYNSSKVKEEELEKTRTILFEEQLKQARKDISAAADANKYAAKQEGKPYEQKDEKSVDAQVADLLKRKLEEKEQAGFDAEKEYGHEAVLEVPDQKQGGIGAFFKNIFSRNEDKNEYFDNSEYFVKDTPAEEAALKEDIKEDAEVVLEEELDAASADSDWITEYNLAKLTEEEKPVVEMAEDGPDGKIADPHQSPEAEIDIEAIRNIINEEESSEPNIIQREDTGKNRVHLSEALSNAISSGSAVLSDKDAEGNGTDGLSLEEDKNEDDVLEGQLSINDWIDIENERRYGGRDTKTFLKSELERELDKIEEKSKAYDSLLKKKQTEKEKSKRPYDEIIRGWEDKALNCVRSARTDLDIRTGKAQAVNENDLVNKYLKAIDSKSGKKPTARSGPIYDRTKEGDKLVIPSDITNSDKYYVIAGAFKDICGAVIPDVATVPDRILDASSILFSYFMENAKDENTEEEKENKNDLPIMKDHEAVVDTKSPEDALGGDLEDRKETYGTHEDAEVIEDDYDYHEGYEDKDSDDTLPYGLDKEEAAEVDYDGKNLLADEDSTDPEGYFNSSYYEDEAEKEASRPEVSEKNLRRFYSCFKNFMELPGIEEAVSELAKELPHEIGYSNAAGGNIIVSGNALADKTQLSKAAARAIEALEPDKKRKIIRVNGDDLNKMGLAGREEALYGNILIIENAGSIQPSMMEQVFSILNADNGRMFVILEDSDAEIDLLEKFNPDLTKYFNHRIVFRQYTVNELVDICKEFIVREGYTVSDDAILAMYLTIDKLHSRNEVMTIEDMNEYADMAIEKAQRRLRKSRRKSGVDSKELVEEDFKI